MNLTFKLALVFFLLLTLSCKERHLFSDQSELATVTRDFEDKQKALPHGDLFRIFTCPSEISPTIAGIII